MAEAARKNAMRQRIKHYWNNHREGLLHNLELVKQWYCITCGRKYIPVAASLSEENWGMLYTKCPRGCYYYFLTEPMDALQQEAFQMVHENTPFEEAWPPGVTPHLPTQVAGDYRPAGVASGRHHHQTPSNSLPSTPSHRSQKVKCTACQTRPPNSKCINARCLPCCPGWKVRTEGERGSSGSRGLGGSDGVACPVPGHQHGSHGNNPKRTEFSKVVSADEGTSPAASLQSSHGFQATPASSKGRSSDTIITPIRVGKALPSSWGKEYAGPRSSVQQLQQLQSEARKQREDLAKLFTVVEGQPVEFPNLVADGSPSMLSTHMGKWSNAVLQRISVLCNINTESLDWTVQVLNKNRVTWAEMGPGQLIRLQADERVVLKAWNASCDTAHIQAEIDHYKHRGIGLLPTRRPAGGSPLHKWEHEPDTPTKKPLQAVVNRASPSPEVVVIEPIQFSAETASNWPKNVTFGAMIAGLAVYHAQRTIHHQDVKTAFAYAFPGEPGALRSISRQYGLWKRAPVNALHHWEDQKSHFLWSHFVKVHCNKEVPRPEVFFIE
ncbi:hypothetical protein CALVIDRAFT_524930 [Calocera viscosa TUFC12733]|uniref:Uncharacterized protein n=1 Tax=Calocera viscosa (strain TUFC12733) TaxID=1330018 RepID=A0A167R876_CALVF|nr:hypothetical protein CALVIDRAFT_524930 [Calocera viscosa TUFC12733]